MAPRHSRPIPIDTAWAQSITGLRLSFPEHWWPGYSIDGLHPGAIVAVNFNQANQAYFQLLLDSDRDDADTSMNLGVIVFPHVL